MDIWRSLAGVLEVTLTAPEPEAALQTVALSGIRLEQVTRVDELTLRFRIARKDGRLLMTLCRKKGWELRICRRRGLYRLLGQLPRRPVLAAGLALLVCLNFLLPTRVLFVEVEGNVTVPTRQILAAAEDSGLGFWASRRELRSEQIKNALLEAVPELKWAGVNTRGCVATISVKEREPEPADSPTYGGITAIRDGFLLSTTVTRGTPLCAPGQTVKAGQTLISGYQDNGLCIRYTGAQGEVIAETRRSITAVFPTDWLEKEPGDTEKRKISLVVGKKRINFWKDSGILEDTCGRMVREYKLTLPGGFRLPVTLVVESYSQDVLTSVTLPGDREALAEFTERCVLGQTVEGTILARQESFSENEGVLRLTGGYVCRESIGQGIETGDIHGKTD